ncbi:MAG: DciA family protein [Geminicoccaceae bacterium]
MARLLGAILDPAARRRGFTEASLLADWSTIIGPVLARRCQPLRVEHAPGRRRGGILVLQTSGAAAIEVQHAAPQLIERINTYFGHRAIRQLRLLQMPLPPVAPPVPPPAPLRPEDEAAIAAGVSEIDDGELRDALLALGRAVRRRH